MLGKKDVVIKDYFIVLDSTQTPVTGLVTGDFTYLLYDPTNAERSTALAPAIVELSNGHYQVSFTPDLEGHWILTIYHATHFPAGKTNTYETFSDTISDLALNLAFIKQMESGRWHMVANQMIFYEDDNVTEICRFNLYDSAGVPSMTNVFQRTKV